MLAVELRCIGQECSLVHNTLNAVESILEHLYSRPVREAHKVVAWAVKQVATSRGVEVKEDARNDNDLLLQAGLEKVETVRDGPGETLEVQPATDLSSLAGVHFAHASR